jgi:hypothetical protein
MSTAGLGLVPERITTLKDIAAFAAAGKGSLDEISAALSAPIDIARFRRLHRAIDRVQAATWHGGMPRTRRQFTAMQSALKGKLFERLIGLVLESSYVFGIYGNVETQTNEIDWLVHLEPLRILLPAVSEWGTHFICECKMSKKALDGNWVTRLYALTQTHGSKVAVLFTAKEIGNSGNSGKPLRAIQDFCILQNPGFIVRVNLAELIDCVENGKSIVAVLSRKYVELRSRRARIGLLTNN